MSESRASLYAQCPECRTLFAVSASVLGAARGLVRCGQCLHGFNALDHLHDAPTDAGPQPSAPDGDTPDAADAPVLDAAAEESAAEPPAEPAVPEVLREDLARWHALRASRRRALAYGMVAIVLVLAMAVQYAWFRPRDLVARYPQARAAVEWFCPRAGCVLPERRDASAVRMTARDVRVHPVYEGALRVTATIVNGATFSQPWPRMRFTLFNVNGQTIAARTFTPREYLDADRARDAQMRPQTPYQIALELLAPDEAAVSFEFRFL